MAMATATWVASDEEGEGAVAIAHVVGRGGE
jgi:hypothetical protein